jgi:S-adenosylmethionine decarboxylase
MKKNKGIHYIFDFVNVKTGKIENYQTKINEILDQIIKEANLNQIDKSSNIFLGNNSPPGFANVRVLDESHISAHSYSNQGILAVDIFTCGNLEKGNLAAELFKKYFKKSFTSAELINDLKIYRFTY